LAQRNDVKATGETQPSAHQIAKPVRPKGPRLHLATPKEIRGVHVTMGLASIKGKLDDYLALRHYGLNTIELDIKDETGAVAFSSKLAPVSGAVGSAGSFYDPRLIARRVHEAGVYLIGRIVTFQDPLLALKRGALAIRRSDGSRWLTSAGLGWVNPFDERVWRYDVSIAEVAARAGFDEIQFDYVRFPSDGDIANAVYPNSRKEPKAATIDRFLHYASSQLGPLGVRVSADVFGLSATRNMGIGQSPRKIAGAVDAISPMVYPSHFGPGQLGLQNPDSAPGTTVAYALDDFARQLAGTSARLVPWLQDFSLGRQYALTDVQDQVLSARRSGAQGFLLWNPECVYHVQALAPASNDVITR
ncbi:MAG: putative glycoside hydrolase, partial [Gaiellaceae bacterium]